MWRMHADRLVKRFDGESLFSDVTFHLHEGDRLALVGENGSGKSTLLRMVAGLTAPDDGMVHFRPEPPSISFLPQEIPDYDRCQTVWDYVKAGHADLFRLERRLHRIEKLMADGPQRAEALYTEYTTAWEQFEALGGYTWQSRLERVLNRMDLPRGYWERRISALSGGERTRMNFARLLFVDPGLLLLDEPTNNLDWPTLEWLEEFFSEYSGTIMYVSHDREFLANTADRVIELSRGSLDVYDCDYVSFRAERRRKRELAWAEYEKQEKEKKRLREVLRRQKQWAARAHDDAGTNDHLRRKAKVAARKAKAVQRRLMRELQDESVKPWEADGINLRITGESSVRPSLVTARDLEVGYDGTGVASGISFEIRRGDRFAILGRNGRGKTTLLRTIQGDIAPVGGQLDVAGSLQPFILDQEMGDADPEMTPEAWVTGCTGADRTAVRTALACLGLRGDAATVPIGGLSVGEKVRALLAQLILVQPPLIFLDEPTNHLDLDAREALEEALGEYEGTLVFTSHDRYFVRRLATGILDLDRSPPVHFFGGYDEYRMRERTDPHADTKLVLEMRASRLAQELADASYEPGSHEEQQLLREYLEIKERIRNPDAGGVLPDHTEG